MIATPYGIDWTNGIRRYFDGIVEAGEAALRQLSLDNPDRCGKTTLSCLSDYFTRALADRIDGAQSVDNSGGTEWVVLHPVAMLRVKSSNEKFQVRNIKTSRLRRYLAGESLEGIPAALPRLDLCYHYAWQANDFLSLTLVERNNDGVVAFVQLPWGGVQSETIVPLELELPETQVRAKPAIAAERRDQQSKSS